MKRPGVRPEIVDDLLSNNWQLSLQVLEIFSRLRRERHHHAQNSAAQLELEDIGRRLAASLSGPWDNNLPLVLTAAWLLGGNRFILNIFRHLKVDDRAEFYPEMADLRRRLANDHPELNFSDYFSALLRQAKVESTTTAAIELIIRLLPPAEALSLIIEIPDSYQRSSALQMFRGRHPGFRCRQIEFGDIANQLGRIPELIIFSPVKNPADSDASDELATALTLALQTAIDNGNDPRLELLCLAAGEFFRGGEKELAAIAAQGHCPALAALARRGSDNACLQLVKSASSWRKQKRYAALSALALCPQDAARLELTKRATARDRREQEIAIMGLSLHPKATDDLWQLFSQTPKSAICHLLLRSLLQNCEKGLTGIPADASLKLFNCLTEEELYPKNIQALLEFSQPELWFEEFRRYRDELPLNLRLPLYALLSRSDDQFIRDFLIELIEKSDWLEAGQLLNLDNQGQSPLPVERLCAYFADWENPAVLTLHEQLKLGRKNRSFSLALADFLSDFPLARQEFVVRSSQRILLGQTDESAVWDGLDQQLKLLLLEMPANSDIPETAPGRYLNLTLNVLQEIELPGGRALTAVVNHCHQYSSFFLQAIQDQLLQQVKREPDFSHEELTELQMLLDFSRGRPKLADLRLPTLQKMAIIIRRCRDLRIFSDAAHDRELRILKVKRNSPS